MLIYRSTLAFLTTCLVSCSSQSKSVLSSTFESYEPSQSEVNILFKGYDLEQGTSTEKVCIDSNPKMDKRKISIFTIDATLVHRTEEIESTLQLNQPRVSTDSPPRIYSIDATTEKKLQFVRDIELKSNRVYFLTSAYLETYTVQSYSEELSSEALTPGFQFREQCGTFFTSGLTYGGLLTVIYEFEVPADMDPFSFGLKVEQQFKQDQFETLLASSKVNTKMLDISGRVLDPQDHPETIFKKYLDFTTTTSTAPVVVKYWLTNYELLPSYPR